MKNRVAIRQLKKLITIFFACAITIMVMIMAATSAASRGAALLDRVLLVSAACIIVATVHLLPALLSQQTAWLVWPIWIMFFVAATYGHTWFFTHANQDAAAVRASMSLRAHAQQEKKKRLEDTLSSIRARPLTTVAQLYARATTLERQQALAHEMAEAQRAARLRDELVSMATVEEASAAADPVATIVAEVFGWPAAAVSLGISFYSAVLLELIGMLAWLEVFRDQESPPLPATSSDVQSVSRTVRSGYFSDLDRTRQAIEAGRCEPSVRSIRNFLNCAQDHAKQIRRDLAASD